MNASYLVVGVAAVALGLVFAAVAWTHILPYREDLTGAEQVDAVVLSSGVVESTNAEGQRVYEPTVTYRYTVEGTEYTSESVFPGDVNPVRDESRAREIVARYPEDAAVTAHVNADDPTSAFLVEQSAPLWFWGGPVVGVLLALYGVYAVVLGLRGVEPSADVA